MFSGVPILKEFLGYTAGLVCPESDDGYHHASSYEVDRESGYYNCICDVCGWPFLAYETDLQQAYETQVSELPITTVSSYGPSLRCYFPTDQQRFSILSLSELDRTPLSFSDSSGFAEVYLLNPFTLVNRSSRGSYYNSTNNITAYFQVPVSGNYYFELPANLDVQSPNDNISYVFTAYIFSTYCAVPFPERDHSSPVVSSESRYFEAGTIYYIVFHIYPEPVQGEICTNVASVSLIPDDNYFSGSFFDPSSPASRPASIIGDYGIIGDNGQITKVDNTSIVNETNNTYTNPCTGTTSTITEWTYDYSDRSYNVTTESGDTVTITYGDENITIQEGDTIYNVYYMVDEDPGGEPGVDPTESPAPETCQHEYTAVTDREATCTFAGQVIYTCSLCGHSYTESIPATGHAWDIKETVQTSYDEEGNLLQQGYTIYNCSVCGEEYKDETGTGPPGSGDGSGSGSGEEGESIWDKLGNLIGTILGTIIDIISAVIGKILDALLALVEMIGDKLVAVVDLVLSFFDEIPRLFSGFLAFLTAVFPFLPEEVMLLLTFGIAVIVFIGIIKALRR